MTHDELLDRLKGHQKDTVPDDATMRTILDFIFDHPWLPAFVYMNVLDLWKFSRSGGEMHYDTLQETFGKLMDKCNSLTYNWINSVSTKDRDSMRALRDHQLQRISKLGYEAREQIPVRHANSDEDVEETQYFIKSRAGIPWEVKLEHYNNFP